MALFGSGGGQFLGVKSPIKPSGKYYIPPHLMVEASANTVTTTAARYNFVPWYFERATTLAGAWCYNSGTGDNGDKAKMALYAESTSGGPGTLAKDFGEITFTGAAAIRTFASSVTLNPGMYYLAFVTDNQVTTYGMSPMEFISGVGYVVPNHAVNAIGSYGVTVAAAPYNSMPSGDYVGGTYANFPEATALTPTATVYGNQTMPLFGVYA